MSKLSRVNQLIFGSTALTNQVAQFGSLAASSPTFSTDPAVIQALSEWLLGWSSAVLGGNSPAIEDMNGAFYVFAYQLAYHFQSGIPEYNSSTIYFIGDMCREVGGFRVYSSVTDSNTGNALSSTANWAPFGAKTRTVTTNTSILVTDNIIRSNSASGDLTHTLPTIASSVGVKITVKDVGSGSHTTTVQGNGSETIDGNIIYATALGQYDSATFYNSGSSWDVL